MTLFLGIIIVLLIILLIYDRWLFLLVMWFGSIGGYGFYIMLETLLR